MHINGLSNVHKISLEIDTDNVSLTQFNLDLNRLLHQLTELDLIFKGTSTFPNDQLPGLFETISKMTKLKKLRIFFEWSLDIHSVSLNLDRLGSTLREYDVYISPPWNDNLYMVSPLKLLSKLSLRYSSTSLNDFSKLDITHFSENLTDLNLTFPMHERIPAKTVERSFYVASLCRRLAKLGFKFGGSYLYEKFNLEGLKCPYSLRHIDVGFRGQYSSSNNIMQMSKN
eukprot:TRINITY_DN5531_c0_g3_i1.p1 TRINITY_DN5531_c0_g3~~TRINITY_DN5531_c0_g3_i1.p1  ORF type:complete len:228 (-),score=31.47 TRINITY_DN5531_c0_g3_i1:104-787(-)